MTSAAQAGVSESKSFHLTVTIPVTSGFTLQAPTSQSQENFETTKSNSIQDINIERVVRNQQVVQLETIVPK